jgi:succinate dehydrogenase/fumarate reductase flavoprotein subunit
MLPLRATLTTMHALRGCAALVALALCACTVPNASLDASPDAGLADNPVPPMEQGPAPWAPPTRRTSASFDTDVIVVGAGLAGISAAIAAVEQGAAVVLLERDDHLGGVSPCTGLMMLFAGTPEQAAAGVDDSPELLLEQWYESTGGDPNDPWVQRFAHDAVPEVRDRIATLTGELMYNPDGGVTLGGVPRAHHPHAFDLPELMAADLPDVRLGAEVIALLEDERGDAVGVRYRDDRGRLRELRAPGTVMATGGFLRDLDRVREHRSELVGVELHFGSGPGADGNGHDLLLEQGATWDNPRAVGLLLHGVPDPRPSSEGEELLLPNAPGGLWVGSDGRRFTDETGTQSDLGKAEDALALSEPPFWCLFDAGGMEGFEVRDPMPEAHEGDLPGVSELEEAGLVVSANSIEELAAAAAIDAEGLAESVSRYNRWVDGEEEEDEFRGDNPYASNEPLREAPFYAVRMALSVSKSFTGIEVDADGRVTDAQGAPLPGLYAAGELTGMAGGSLVGDVGFDGSYSAVMLSGLVAGRTAARDVLGD